MAAIVVKLGSSIVAHDDGTLRADVIGQVCHEVAALQRGGDRVVIVTSGAVARGIGELGLGGRPRAMDELQAASAVGQGDLFRVYDERLAAEGVRSAQMLLTFFDMSARGHYINARRTLYRLIEWGVVPVINENDTTTTHEISFGDNDFLAAQVAVLIAATRLVLLTDTAGLHTADPRRDPAAELVRQVQDVDELGDLRIGHATSPLGSGGMRSKVVAAEMATAAGIPAVICSGLEPGALTAAAAGEPVGTEFAPAETRHSSFKLWLKYAKPSQGRIEIDAGAARALREGGTSLLPVGIVAVSGGFDVGDAVDVVADGDLVGKGITNYTAAELRRIKGLHSGAAQEVVPRGYEEAVHRDYFVLE